MIQAAEDEVAELAKEAARADALARAAKKAESGQAQELEMQRLKVLCVLCRGGVGGRCPGGVGASGGMC